MAPDGGKGREAPGPAPRTRAEQEGTEPIREAWGLLFRLLRHFRGNWAALHQEFELTPVQGHVLHLMEPGAVRPMHGLADVLGCDASNVTGLVDRLEARGLLERRSAEHDRRVKMLALTPEGEKLRGQLLERLREPPEELRQLSQADQRLLRDALRRTLQAVGIPEV